MTRPPRPVHAAAALALLALPLVLVWLGAVAPYLDRRAVLLDDIAAARAQIARFGAGRTDPRPSGPRLTAPDALLAAPAPALAAATLQALVDTALETAGGTRSAAQLIDPRAEDGVMRVSVTVDALFDPPALTRFLTEIETTTPFLFVDLLEIRRVDPAPEPTLSPAPGEPADETLAVRITVSAITDMAQDL